jgi:hypothetical protein
MRGFRPPGGPETGFKLSVGLTGQVYLLEIEGLFTPGSRPGRTVGGSVGGIFLIGLFSLVERDSVPGLRYQTRH